MIIRKIQVDKKDPYTVAKETNHSILAVDRYILRILTGYVYATKMARMMTLSHLQPDLINMLLMNT